MKKLVFVFALIISSLCYGQQGTVAKSEMLIIIDGQIVTEEKVDEYMRGGYLKSITVGVSDEKRAELKQKLGDRIDDNTHIAIVTLYTKEEKEANDKKEAEKVAEKPAINIKRGEGSLQEAVQPTIDDSYNLRPGDRAADFTVEMLAGGPVKLSQFWGKVVLLNFWATWCVPCMREFEEFPDAIVKPFAGKDFVLLPVARGEDRATVAKKMESLKDKGIDFNVGYDPKEQVWAAYANNFIPKNFLIDRNGVIRYVSTGYGLDDPGLTKLAAKIKELLEEE